VSTYSDDRWPICPQCGSKDLHCIEVRGVYDGGLIWSCQTCEHKWPRFAVGKLNVEAKSIIAKWAAA
jgi:ssDNA-binding Zn-finger/Zn-ribbon topoisomerase 1